MTKPLSLLRAARVARGLSLQDLATALGISKPALSRYERGAATMSESTAVKVSALLGLPMSSIAYLPNPSVGRRTAIQGHPLTLLRAARGLTQQQLADLAGLKRQVIAKYESAASRPRPENLHKLAQALGVNPLDITLHQPTSRPLRMNWLAKIRRERGLTRIELAKSCGVNQATLWYIEAEKGDYIRTATLQKLADALGMTLSEIEDLARKG